MCESRMHLRAAADLARCARREGAMALKQKEQTKQLTDLSGKPRGLRAPAVGGGTSDLGW